MLRKVIALAVIATVTLALGAGCKDKTVVNPKVKDEVPKDKVGGPVQPGGPGGAAKGSATSTQ